MRNVLRTKGVRYSYGKSTALSYVDFSASSGVTAILGPNSSGKTTLLRVLAAILAPDEGIITYNGEVVGISSTDYKRRLGYLPQDFFGYGDLTVDKFLVYMSGLKMIPTSMVRRRIGEVVADFGLAHKENTTLARLSRGELQRVGLAVAMLNDPDILVLDEPTAALDVEEKSMLLTKLQELGQERTVVFATHLASDAECCADSVTVMKEGEVIISASPTVISSRAQGLTWVTPEISAPNEAFVINMGDSFRVLCACRPHPNAVLVPPTLEDGYLAIVRQHYQP